MRPLSSAYHQDLIRYFIQNDAFYATDGIKNLILSSCEMSHAYGVFMQKHVVELEGGYSMFRILMDDFNNCGIFCQGWMAHFVRRLVIACDFDGTETDFFEKIFHSNRLMELNLRYVKNEFIPLAVVQNLISITQKLAINGDSLDQYKDIFPRCDVVLFCDSGEMDQSTVDLDSDSSFALQVNLSSFRTPQMRIDAVNKVKAQCPRIRQLYFECNGCFTLVSFNTLIRSLSTLSPNVENVTVGIRVFVFNYAEPVADEWKTVREKFDSVVAILRQVPPRIKAKIFYTVISSSYREENPLTTLETCFPKKDFIITRSGRRKRNITIRQEKLSENVEFLYSQTVFGFF